MKYIYLAIFIIFTSIHLYASHKKNQNLRNITKGFILLAVIGFYASSVEKISYVLIAALLTSWIGDMFLIPKSKKWFVVGGISFLISHVLFAIAYSQTFTFANVSLWFVIPIAIVYAVTVVFIFSKLKERLGKALFLPMFFYLLTNGCMNCFAIYRLISLGTLGSAITAIGAVLFFISDSSLFFIRFPKNNGKEKSHFIVMLTYSLAELLIVLGLII